MCNISVSPDPTRPYHWGGARRLTMHSRFLQVRLAETVRRRERGTEFLLPRFRFAQGVQDGPSGRRKLGCPAQPWETGTLQSLFARLHPAWAGQALRRDLSGGTGRGTPHRGTVRQRDRERHRRDTDARDARRPPGARKPPRNPAPDFFFGGREQPVYSQDGSGSESSRRRSALHSLRQPPTTLRFFFFVACALGGGASFRRSETDEGL